MLKIERGLQGFPEQWENLEIIQSHGLPGINWDVERKQVGETYISPPVPSHTEREAQSGTVKAQFQMNVAVGHGSGCHIFPLTH